MAAERATLGELAALFFRLGATAFGGPAAHVAMMEREVVQERRWLTREQFLDLFAASNLIPGPSSTELAIHIGHGQRGWPGLVVAGVCFIVPAMCIVLAIAAAYVAYGVLPEVRGIFAGIAPVVVAIIGHAVFVLARSAVKSVGLGILGATALAAAFAGVHELAILGAAGALALGLVATTRDARSIVPWLPFAALGATAVPYSLPSLFGFFVKIGSVLYGSGYVLVAFLRADLVERYGWLSEIQLLDAIAVGQVTPGPVFTTATFIGYVLDGPAAALVATAGIFLPAFVFVALSVPLLPRIRQSKLAGAFLDGVTVASLALMLYAAALIARSTLPDPITIGIAVVSLAALIRWRINPTWLVAGGALVGLVRALGA